LARSNYQFQKRQKELARKKKKEEKRNRKLEKSNPPGEEIPEEEHTG
jgi:LAS superfamily LD-carboxypeptidase LdcB